MDKSFEDSFSEKLELAELFDIYSPLLSDHKKSIFEDYCMNDLSLAEIAEQVKLSRQGVRDIIVRCSAELRDYESKLKIAQHYRDLDDTAMEIDALVQDSRSLLKEIGDPDSLKSDSEIVKIIDSRLQRIADLTSGSGDAEEEKSEVDRMLED